jgi:hypothetical protein
MDEVKDDEAREPGTSLQTWGTWDEEEAEKDKREADSGGNFFKITEPKVYLRFLPPRKGVKNPFLLTWQHYVELVPKNEKTLVKFNCPRKMSKGAQCPLCQLAERKKATGKESDRNRAYELFPRMRVYSGIVNRREMGKGAQIFPMGKKIFQQLLNLREDGNFTCPVKGFDVMITKKGSTKNDTEYLVKGSRNNTPLSDDPDELKDLIKSLPDLSAYATVPTADEIKELMQAALDAADSDDDDGGGRGFAGERLPNPDQSGRNTSGRRSGRGEQGYIDTRGEPMPADSDDVWGGGGAGDDEEDF